MTAFRQLTIPSARRYWLRDARVPTCLLAAPTEASPRDIDGTILVDLLIDDGRIAGIAPAGTAGAGEDPTVALDGRHVWPTLVDMHTHLDKGHIVTRTQNPDGSFTGARESVVADRIAHWRQDDVERRMAFGLRCAYAHGVSAIRTHIDSYEGQVETSWSVFRRLRDAWSGRIELQGVALFPLDLYRTEHGLKTADVAAQSGGVLGGVTRGSHEDHRVLLDDTDVLLDRLFQLATERSLDVDLHVDESGDPAAASLGRVAAAVLRNRFKGRVVCGHCCSLAVQSEELVRETIALVAEAGISIVSLPTVNMYLQDRGDGRTPRWRGVTLIHELRAAGITVAVAGDNCRDPFHAYGDHDMVDTFRQAVRIEHLDHPFGDAPALAAAVPGGIIDVSAGTLAIGGAARLILFNARTLNELVCRPQSDRVVIDRGREVTDGLPDYSELEIAG
ncbi:MAG: cytosine deaminase [Rhodospirillales bacterium]|nr:cytosine deaminase [Rhodospirillales bacterium]